MSLFLGIDTSNYTTSLAIYDSENGSILQQKKLLPVKDGALGLRQSDALFHHVKRLPALADELFKGIDGRKIAAIGVSTQPRRREDSYMPCFLAGQSLAECMGSALSVPVHAFSHQEGHVAAALYGSGHLEWMDRPFLAFHFSGGTSDGLSVTPKGRIFSVEQVSGSLDLKAGQAVDRIGLMLGLSFPAGPELEKLAEKSEKTYRVKAVMKGCGCSFSGVENRCRRMMETGEAPCDIARYCLDFIAESLSAMTESLIEQHGQLPLLYAGGVMSNQYIRKKIENRFGGVFCPPIYSSDNAAGIAVLTAKTEQED